MLYCIFVLNHLAHAVLHQMTPIEMAFGHTPDISIMLTTPFWQPVLYFDHETAFPSSKEKSGRIVGFADNVGDALCYQILTDDTQQIITRSVIRHADSDSDPNLRSFPSGGEGKDSSSVLLPKVNMSEEPKLKLWSPNEPSESDDQPAKLPTVDPLEIVGRTFLRKREADGSMHRAEVIKRMETVDGETEQFLVRLGDGKREEVMTYNEVVEAINRQLEREESQTDEERLWIYKAVKNHRKNGNTWDVLLKWEDDSETWEPLTAVWRSDPVTLARYAEDNDLLGTKGWKRLRYYTKNKKKMNRMLRQCRLNSMRHATRIKYGVRVPKDYEEAKRFDELNGNTLWIDSVKLEMDQIYDYGTVESKGKGANISVGYTKIRVHFMFDVKQDGRRKARLVAGGHMTGPNTDTYYSSVVSLRSMRITMFLVEHNDLD